VKSTIRWGLGGAIAATLMGMAFGSSGACRIRGALQPLLKEYALCPGRVSRQDQCLGEIFPAKVWVTIFPSFTTNVSVPSS
jgi:hypothetical protein